MFKSIRSLLSRINMNKNMDSNDIQEVKKEDNEAFYVGGKWPDFNSSKASKIEDHLYLSGSPFAENIEKLNALDIKYILSVFNDELKPKSDSITYLKIEAEDYYLVDLLTHFPKAIEFISSAQESGQNVLVHCHAGISRSATIVLAFLMNKYKMSYDSARALVNAKRAVSPNEGFVAQLELYGEMEFTLNANYRKFRQHLIANILNIESSWTTIHFNHIAKYFERRDFAEGMTKDLNLGAKYVCVNCGQHLFNEIHIFQMDVTKEKESDPRKVCEWTYIEPQKWMNETIKGPFKNMSVFVIKCLKCDEQVIEFKQHFCQYWCECSHHLGLYGRVLLFRIANQKYRIETNE